MLEEDLFYDKYLTWQEKNVFVRKKINNSFRETFV